MIICNNCRIFLVYSRKESNEKGTANAESQGLRPTSSLLSSTARVPASHSGLHLSIPMGHLGRNPAGELPRSSEGLKGHVKKGFSSPLPLCCLPLCLSWGEDLEPNGSGPQDNQGYPPKLPHPLSPMPPGG